MYSATSTTLVGGLKLLRADVREVAVPPNAIRPGLRWHECLLSLRRLALAPSTKIWLLQGGWRHRGAACPYRGWAAFDRGTGASATLSHRARNVASCTAMTITPSPIASLVSRMMPRAWSAVALDSSVAAAS